MDNVGAGMRFCVECGAAIPNGSEFCYACGAMAPKAPAVSPTFTQTDSSTEQGARQQTGAPQFGTGPYVVVATPESMASSISTMILIWGVIAVTFGAVDMVASFFLVDIGSFYGTTISSSEVYTEAGCLLISGATALVSSLLLKKHKMFWPCFICCLVSAFTSYYGMGGFVGIMTTLVGFYMSFAITRCRAAFKS